MSNGARDHDSSAADKRRNVPVYKSSFLQAAIIQCHGGVDESSSTLTATSPEFEEWVEDADSILVILPLAYGAAEGVGGRRRRD